MAKHEFLTTYIIIDYIKLANIQLFHASNIVIVSDFMLGTEIDDLSA